jgi:hypothetical protein
MNASLPVYIDLITSFVEKKITPAQFEKKYLQLFKYDESRSEEIYEILNPLFWAVEDFCPYPELREKGDIDEDRLLESAITTLDNLKKIDSSILSIIIPQMEKGFEKEDRSLTDRLVNSISLQNITSVKKSMS